MTLDEFRSHMEEFRSAADAEATSLKDSYLVLDRLHALYKGCDLGERLLADRVLAEWALSDDESVRFDALALIHDFRIASAMPSLRALAQRLAASTAPSAPYELRKVRRIIGDLASQKAT